nr:hypothetical protein [Candidatus Sigynarchaeota archaeon]
KINSITNRAAILVLEKFNGNVTYFEDAHLVVEKVFETDLLFPYSARIISPNEETMLSNLERIVYKHGLDQAQRKGFFFIATVVEALKNALQKPSKDVIHAIYELVKKEYFIPEKIDSAARYLDEVQTARNELEKEKSSLSGISSFISSEEIGVLKENVRAMPEKEARALVKKFMSTANSRLSLGIYDDAFHNYELAKVVASEAALVKDLHAIQAKIDEVVLSIYSVEYDNAMKIAVSAEKNKDFLKAIQHYNACRLILVKNFKLPATHKRVQQIERRIATLQEKER